MKIIAVGDIMPGGVLNKREGAFAQEAILDIFQNADLRVGTLETAIGNAPTFSEEKMSRLGDVIYAEDCDMHRLTELGIDIVSLANNHFFDLGVDGARHTIEMLDKLGIKHCGAGMNQTEAAAPAVVEHGGKTYAFIGCCDWRDETVGWCPMATDEKPGVNPMTFPCIAEQIRKAKKAYDYVVVMPHWGVEYRPTPTSAQYNEAKLMLQAGADAILGSHTHCIQPTVRFDGKPVVFSMGNFLFPDRLLVAPRSTYYPDSPVGLDTLPVTYGYPYVETLTYKRWKPQGRVGQITAFELPASTNEPQKYYTQLTDDNRLELTDAPLNKTELKMASVFLNMGMFAPYQMVYRVVASIKYRLNRLLS